ncbi:Sir2 family NAD-dependent protein deacetylase [Citricoccus sp. NR2]|uniref:Sir2 family NAD-dependent protein deacetylase n=1 Tax=Citricoccus sp. NR2 TaxID=3004095 RepID=UPI0022DD970C|nr:Sir2 family NAD-dependent protein deacetylase [Citricoccus sp. NR2]WBL20418.1 NAD-dependent protein deacetylase [Citricoccus sp. NR2]
MTHRRIGLADIEPDHPAHRAHQAALRSIDRVVHDDARPQGEHLARPGVLGVLRQSPLIITGAGVSTDSGIPDYRGPQGSLRRHRPMTYQEFRFDAAARQRYWARSYVGWRQMVAAAPNDTHRILAEWNACGLISGIVTQNVDGLHAQAAREVASASQISHEHDPAALVALHGDLDRVICLNCGAMESRHGLDARLDEVNPGYIDAALSDRLDVNPDGDVTLPDELIGDFQMVACLNCGSFLLKPDVVYFGESVPPERRRHASELLDDAGGLLVIGSSLAVMSGYRFVLDAQRAGKPVALINAGPTRADAKAEYRWRARVAPAVTWLHRQLET